MKAGSFGRRALFGALLGTLLAIASASCASGGEDGATKDGEDAWVQVMPEPAEEAGRQAPHRLVGTVRYLDLEGGLYVIRDAEGTNHNPTNLPAEFRVDGLAVEAAVRGRDDLMSIGMVGPMVDIVRIRER